MEDKIFNLLEQMQSNFMAKFDQVHEELKGLKDGQNKINIKLENSIEPKINMCLEEIVGIKEKLVEHDKRFDSIDSKIEQHDVEISVIKRVK